MSGISMSLIIIFPVIIAFMVGHSYGYGKRMMQEKRRTEYRTPFNRKF